MPVARTSVEIYAPIDKLWEYVNDREKDPEWIRGFVQRRPLNAKVGEVGERYLLALDYAGRRYEMTCETVGLEEHRLIRTRQVEGPFGQWESTQGFEETDSGVKYTHTLDYVPPGSAVSRALFSRKLREDIEQKLHRSTWKVKEFVEALDWF